MNRYLYILLIIIFYVPVYMLAFWIIPKKYFQKSGKLLGAGLVFATCGYLTEYLALQWNAWEYYFPHTLGVKLLGKSVIETLIWAILGVTIFAIFLFYFADREEKKKPFFKK